MMLTKVLLDLDKWLIIPPFQNRLTETWPTSQPHEPAFTHSQLQKEQTCACSDDCLSRPLTRFVSDASIPLSKVGACHSPASAILQAQEMKISSLYLWLTGMLMPNDIGGLGLLKLRPFQIWIKTFTWTGGGTDSKRSFYLKNAFVPSDLGKILKELFGHPNNKEWQ